MEVILFVFTLYLLHNSLIDLPFLCLDGNENPDDEDDGEVDHEEFSGSEDGGSPQRGARDLEQCSIRRQAPLADVGEQSNQNSRSTSSISMGSRTRGQGGGSPGRGVVF